MAKNRGLPKDLKLLDGMVSPDDKPARLGDYIDEEVAERPRPRRRPRPVVETSAEEKPVDKGAVASPAEEAKSGEVPKRRTADVKRQRLNVSLPARDRVSKIVDRMRSYGPEPFVNASDVIEAAILALYEAREHLDLSNVRRRGKYGSPSHKNFPVALAESVRRAIAEADKVSEGL